MSEAKIVFYCRDCETTVEGKRMENKYIYSCPICRGNKVSFGTPQSVVDFYHIRENK